MKLSLGIVFLFLSSYALFGQTSKFGEVSLEELEMKTYQPYPSASAVVLFDEGVNKFDANNIQMVYTRHKRIKILKRSGLSEADVAIPYVDKAQKLTVVKAATYNLIDGKIVSIPLNKKTMYNEKTIYNVITQKFSFQNVHEGSVVEYEYTIITDYFTYIPDWTFQGDIPVALSSFTTEIPGFLEYVISRNGVLANTVYQKSTKHIYINANEIDLNTYTWKATNVPPFSSEPFINSDEQQTAGIEFELSKVKIPSFERDYAPTYAAYSEKLKSRDDFGRQLQVTGLFRSFMPAKLKNMKTESEKMKAIYDSVIKNITWDGQNDMFPDPKLKNIRNTKVANSAGLNLTLLLMLREAGIKADPVILATRDMGNISTTIPMTSKLNYVIVRAMIDGKPVLLDATDPLRPAGMLPFRCMNGKGWVVNDNGEWVDLRTHENYSALYTGMIRLSSNNHADVETTTILEGYNALHYRNNLNILGIDEARKQITDSVNTSVKSWEVQNSDSLYLPLVINQKIGMPYALQNAGNKLLLRPFLFFPVANNPFVLEQRKYPIDFGCPIIIRYNLTIFVPDSLEVVAIPKREVLTLPNGDAKFQLNGEAKDNQINISCLLQINKSIFPVSEYNAIRAFYTMLDSKQSEYIVFKKK